MNETTILLMDPRTGRFPEATRAMCDADWRMKHRAAAGPAGGAVVLVGLGDRILYHQAFGQRGSGEAPATTTADTVFDLASLTKVVVTTTAILQLAERHQLDLDAPAARYWPAFGANGKQAITSARSSPTPPACPQGSTRGAAIPGDRSKV